MKFIDNVNESDYRIFCNKYQYHSFMQSYEWGEFNKQIRNMEYFHVGLLDDDNNLIATALLLKKKTPLNMSYIYSPRGFQIDFKNKELLTTFTTELKKFCKSHNAIYLKIDPEINYQDIDDNGNKVESGANNYEIFNNLISLGYKHQGFGKLFDYNQPRYTFRIPFNEEFESTEKKISKTFMRTIKRSYYYDLEVVLNDDIKTFYDLLLKISDKDKFLEYDYEYYQKMYDLLSTYNHIKMHSVIIKPDELLTKIKKDLETTPKVDENKTKLERLEKDLEFFSKLEGKYPDGKIIASVISVYTNIGAWAIYIGNDDIAQYTFTVNRLYYEFTKYAHSKGLKFFDLYGTVGDPKTTYKNLAGIHEYKRKFGGDYIEFIGEFDIIFKPFWYILLPKLLWIYRKIKRILKK